MASCDKCLFYSKEKDEQNRDFNDVGDPGNHYCPMYQDAIPEGVFNGAKDCEFYKGK